MAYWIASLCTPNPPLSPTFKKVDCYNKKERKKIILFLLSHCNGFFREINKKLNVTENNCHEINFSICLFS